MKAYLSCATGALILAGTVGASAQTTIIERQGPAVIEREAPAVIEREAPAVVTRERVELTPAQRTTIYRTVTRERTHVAPREVEVRLGARVPRSVELREMPTTLVEDVPSVRRYRYMVVNNEVVLVDPATSEVIEIIRQ